MEKDTKKRKDCKEVFTVKIGKKLKEVLDIQKKQIEEVTYGCVKPSYVEAGEIIAMKVLKEI